MGCAESSNDQVAAQTNTSRHASTYAPTSQETIDRRPTKTGMETREPQDPTWWMAGFADVHKNKLQKLERGEPVPGLDRPPTPESPPPAKLMQSIEQWLESSRDSSTGSMGEATETTAADNQYRKSLRKKVTSVVSPDTANSRSEDVGITPPSIPHQVVADDLSSEGDLIPTHKPLPTGIPSSEPCVATH